MGKRKTIIFIISILAGSFILFLWWVGVFQGLEYKSVDYRFWLRGAIKPSEDIVIISIDEKSIRHFGRWPWTRDVHARLVNKLTDMGAKVIAFDVLFTEPDLEHSEDDKEFGEAIKRSGRVVLNSFFQMVKGKADNPLLPITPLRAYKATGFANIFTEVDGINRRIPVFMDYKGEKVPSLSMAALSVYLNKSPQQIIRDYRIPMDEFNEMTINFSGGFEVFPYYSFHEVLQGKIPSEKFRDKIVLVGGTATALFDFKAIPYAPVFPGVEIHANVISNILLKNYLKPWPTWATFILIVFFSLLSGLVLGRISPIKGGFTALLIFFGYFYFTYFLFAKKNISAEYIAPTLSLVFSYGGSLFYRYMTEEREKRHLKKTFSHFLSASVMEKILSDPSFLKLGGQRQILTVLFSDIRGFTTISESMDCEQVVALLNEYLTKMVDVVFKYDGTLDKFIGDAVMAFWGAPIPQKDHSKRAVLCAIDMLEELSKLQKKWKSEGKSMIEIGIGVNTGEMTVGNMGSKERMDYTVIGDNVNLASRLEGLNKEYSTRIIISESTYNEVKDVIEARHIGAVKVKGKTKPVEVYNVLGKKGQASKQEKFDPDSRIQVNKAEI